MDLYKQVIEWDEYKNPIAYDKIVPQDYDGMILIGGHAAGMNTFLNSETMQTKLSEFYNLKRPIAAICHGVLILSRTKNKDGKSLIHDRKVCALPMWLEIQAYLITAGICGVPAKEYQLSTTWPNYVQGEIQKEASEFVVGPYHVLAPLFPGTATNHFNAFAYEDFPEGKSPLVTARFWSDSYLWTNKFAALLETTK